MNATPAARSRSRQFLVQALYQAHMTGEEYAAVGSAFAAEHNMKRADIDYFSEVMHGVHAEAVELWPLIEAKLDRGLDEIDPIEKGILLMGCYELKHRIDVPFKVVISEGVSLAQSFGATDSFKYINSILDALAKDLRPHG